MKTALITGASRGLGEAIARLLTERGYSVLTPSHAELDISDPASIARFKVDHLDVLINNAAVLGATLSEAVEVNVMGAALLTHQVWRRLMSNGGRVINISSREGLTGWFGNRHYSVSKVALNVLTRATALNYPSDGVEVCACCPGWFRSKLGGIIAPRLPGDAADTPVWLATEATDINGKFYIDRKVVPW